MTIDIKVLKSKIPLNSFPDNCLEAIAKIAVVTQHKKDDVMFQVGDNDEMTAFLILGVVALTSIDDRTTVIRHNDIASKFGLANLKPRKYTAKAVQNNTCLLWVKSELINNLFDDYKNPNIAVGRVGFS